jgi:5-methylcytosine-specific restriction endonuclease McrA
MKLCSGCGEKKPLDAFTTTTRTRDGRTSNCRVCRNAEYRERYQRKREQYRTRKRDYRLKNAEAIKVANRERTKRWRDANPERARAKSAAATLRFRAANPDYTREWYQRNLEQARADARESMRRWREANPEDARAIRKRYREANIDEVRKRERENTHRRRALKGSTSPALAEFMAELITQPCTYCGATENITVDHVIPLSRGGKHEAANLTAACYSCNSSKGAKLLDEWDHGEPVVP